MKLANLALCISLIFSQLGPAAAARVPQTTDKTKLLATATGNSEQLATADLRLHNAISEIDRLAAEQVDKQVLPGLAISIVHGGKVVYSKGFGLRQVGKPEAINADTVFPLASISKSITSTVVAGIVSDGKISWDSRICDLDPAFQMRDPWVTRELTIRDLLAHRSGLPEHAGDILEDIGYDQAQVLHRLRYQRPDSSFRSAYAYTNFGYTEGALAAARSCNQSWQDVCESKLFKPLSMNSTSTRYADFMTRSNKALSHVRVDGKWIHKVQRDPDAQSPAGGVSSSVNDMANWMCLQIASGKFDGKQVIPAKALDETHHPQMLTRVNPLNGMADFYGLGFNVSYDHSGRLNLGHSGAFCLGAGTCVSMIPSEQLGICVLTNAYPIGVAEGISKTFIDLALYGKLQQEWLPLLKKIFSNPEVLGVFKGTDYSAEPVSPTAALKNSAYVGRYSNEYFGELEIVEKDGALALLLGPQKMSFPIKHYDRDIFTYDIETENLTGKSGIRFAVAADGRADNVLVENLNVRGDGLFHRVKVK
jgi:CubicO group peptidase (beta-lactamase class C family)